MSIQSEISTFVVGTAGAASIIVGKVAAAVVSVDNSQDAEVTALPEWANYMLGPLGAVVVMGGAVLWLTKRLEKQEKADEARQAKREELLAEQVKASTLIAAALDRNNRILDRIEERMDHKKL